jgi:hypothetical protein
MSQSAGEPPSPSAESEEKHWRKKYRIFLIFRVETKMPFQSRKMRNLVDFHGVSKISASFSRKCKTFYLQPYLDPAFVSLVIIYMTGSGCEIPFFQLGFLLHPTN